MKTLRNEAESPEKTDSEAKRQQEGTLQSIATRKTVAEATNLNKYVPEEHRTIPTTGGHVDDEQHTQTLEEHLLEISKREVDVAIANQFLPLMMIPEAAEFSAHQQTRYSQTIFPRITLNGNFAAIKCA